MMKLNTLDWLIEAEEAAAQQAPTSSPPLPAPAPKAQAQPPAPKHPQKNKQSQDFDEPEFPDDDDFADNKPKDFETWRHELMKLSIRGDVNSMIDSIGVINKTKLEAPQRKFISDNLQILLYRQEDNVTKVCKEVRNLIKNDLDRINPGSSIMQHLTSALQKEPVISQNFIKLTGLYALKGELHRKFICSLMGAIQIGGAGDKADLLFCGENYTVNLSTRFATQFEEINLGKWSLKTDDPEKYLSDSELTRLNEGSPEEKQVLRRRIIIESIAEKFKERGFLIHVVHEDGTIHSIGWDLGESLSSAYKEGKIVVRSKHSEERDAMISDDGKIISLVDLEILFVTESGETDDSGNPGEVEVPFMERKEGNLYLCADLETIRMASSGMSGLFFNEMPYNGNPSELSIIRGCVPSLVELIGRRCK